MSRFIAALVCIAAVALALHAAAWLPALIVIERNLHPPPLQSAIVLALSALLLRVADVWPRRPRLMAVAVVLIIFGVAMTVMPLDPQFGGNGFMGDGYDYSQDRDKFQRNVPVAAEHQELHFKSHLGDLILAVIDRLGGRTDTSPALAYATLSRIGGVLFIGELALVLAWFRGSRRVCRFIALALATPLTLTFFGYYELGYLAACIALFPLVLYSITTRRQTPALDVAGGLQGLHTALHGFGLLGIAGGALAALSARRRGISSAFRFSAFAFAFYLGWLVVYIVGLGMSIISDPYSSHIAYRKLGELYFFDRRFVHPLVSWNGINEVGMASLAIGVPLLLLGPAAALRARAGARLHSVLTVEHEAALLFALPSLFFLIVWWPSAGVQHDMDLLLGAFGAIGAAVWVAARTTRAAFIGWIVLAITHLMFWAVIADRSMDRIWLPQ